MSDTPVIATPAFPPERLAERLAEVIRFINEPGAFALLPPWVQRVLLILRDQLVPPEFASIFTAQQALLAEGVCLAWIAHARDAIADPAGGPFARGVAEWMTRAPETRHVVHQLGTGEIVQSPEFRDHVMRRLFAGTPAERQAFTDGLALGNRVYDLLARHSGQRSTDATRIYVLLWLYWPEISRLGSISEAAEHVRRLLGGNRNLIGQSWDERFRKIANRIGLSYREQQVRLKSSGAKRAPARRR
jgi:hypothetical protein